VESVSETVGEEELAWREWWLGEGSFAEHGRRNGAVRAQTGAPARIPKEWWERLEAALAARHDGSEPAESPSLVRRAIVAVGIPTPKVHDPSQLTPHFHLSEFACKDGTAVPKSAVPALRKLCTDVLEPLRERFGPCTIMSGYRHSAYNKRIGGATFSQHVYDLHPSTVAADLVFKGGRPAEWADAAEPLLLAGGLGRYPSFVHVDNRGTRARWSG
jgi:hypothetical protein